MRCWSGYLGSAEQGDEILAVVAAVKAANPAAIYFAIPSWGTRRRVA